MAADRSYIARELGRWLQTRPGVGELRVNLNPARTGGIRVPMPLPLPLPPFLRGRQPSFELRFVYKGEPRQFRYFLEQTDDPGTMLSTLRVDTNGELLVRVPNAYGQLMPNDIYYGNRSTTAPGLGEPAPNPRSKG